MFNDQDPQVVTAEEVEDFVASLHQETESPLQTLISEVTDELAYSSTESTDGTEDAD
jgi:hypothetical protein